MKNFFSVVKLISVFITIGAYFLSTVIFYPGIILFPYQTKKILNRIVSLYSRILCRILCIKINLDSNVLAHTGNHFIVANHLSYIDILVVTTFVPTCFVTSIEMKKTPLLGQICQLAGCLFVERRSRTNLKNEIKDIENALAAGLNVMVFPEATSTNGEQVLKFKRSLFQAPLNTNVDILPLTFNYLSIDSEPVTIKNRDLVCWYGEMTFFPHLWGLCQLEEIIVEVKSSDKIRSSTEMKCSGVMRDLAYDKIVSTYSIIQ